MILVLSRALSLLMVTLLGGGMLFGQSAEGDIWSQSRPSLRSFGLQEGLPSSTVYQVREDRAGRLWAATQDGTAFYDGLAWTAFAPPRNSGVTIVRAILEGRDGSRWLGSEHAGLWRHKDGAWSSFGAGKGLLVDRVNFLLETTDAQGMDTLWVCTGGGGVAAFSDGKWRVFGEQDGLPTSWVWRITSLPKPGGGQELVVSTPKGLARLRGDRWEPWAPVPGLAEGERGCLLWVDDGNSGCYWMTAWGRGLVRWDGKSAIVFNPSNGFPSYHPTSIAATRTTEGKTVIWAGTYDKGLFRFEDGRWFAVDDRENSPSSGVYDLLVPRRGKPTLWIARRDGGVGRLDQGSWRTLDRESGLPSAEVTCLTEYKDPSGRRQTWIGTAKGLACWESGGWRRFTTRNGLPSDRINALLAVDRPEGQQRLWVGTQKGLAYWEKGRWSKVSLAGLADDQVFALAETRAPDGSPILWVGSEAGVLRIHGRERRVFSLKDGLPSLNVYHFLETDDPDGGASLWAATRGGGVARFKGGQWSSLGKAQGFPSPSIYHLKETRSRDGQRWIWAASFGRGLLRRSLNDENAPWEVFDDQVLPGLPSNVILRLEEDASGALYVMTQRGVARLRFEDPLHPAQPTGLEVFSSESGLPSPLCSFGASFRDASGRIWVGTPHGAAVLDPRLETPVPPPMGLVLEQVRVGGLIRESMPSQSFSHRENALLFQFSMPQTAKDGDAYFRTQLLGLESEPTAWTQAPRREFAGLPSGSYTFRIWGRDQLGREVHPLDVPFSIRPAPWRHPLAWLIYLASGLLGILGVVQARHRVLRRHNEELEGKVKERTLQLEARSLELVASEHRAQEASQAKTVFLSNMSHELRTPLNAILGFARLLRRNVGLRPQDQEHLDRIHRAGEHLLGLINDVLSLSKIEAGRLVLNPAPFELRPFLRGIEEMMQARADEKGLILEVNLDPGLPEACHGDEGKLRQVLINLLGNGIKFTTTGTVGLRVQLEEGRIQFKVCDTGPGMDPVEQQTLFQEFTQLEAGRQSREGTGLGLHISQAIVRLMGGDIQVDSQLGKGTTFSFSLEMEVAKGEVRKGVAPRYILGLARGELPRKVLVVDDERDNRDVIRELLETWGFHVRVAEDGLAGLEAWEQWRPDAVFMDLRMPRMNGETAAVKLRSLEGASKRIPVIALSASVLGIDRERVLQSGFDEFIQKPFHEHVIAEVLERYLGVRFQTETLAGVRPPVPPPIQWDDLPESWRQGFRQALLLGDMDEAQACLEALGAHPARENLDSQLKEFRIEEILQQLGG